MMIIWCILLLLCMFVMVICSNTSILDEAVSDLPWCKKLQLRSTPFSKFRPLKSIRQISKQGMWYIMNFPHLNSSCTILKTWPLSCNHAIYMPYHARPYLRPMILPLLDCSSARRNGHWKVALKQVIKSLCPKGECTPKWQSQNGWKKDGKPIGVS